MRLRQEPRCRSACSASGRWRDGCSRQRSRRGSPANRAFGAELKTSNLELKFLQRRPCGLLLRFLLARTDRFGERLAAHGDFDLELLPMVGADGRDEPVL